MGKSHRERTGLIISDDGSSFLKRANSWANRRLSQKKAKREGESGGGEKTDG